MHQLPTLKNDYKLIVTDAMSFTLFFKIPLKIVIKIITKKFNIWLSMGWKTIITAGSSITIDKK